MDERRPIGDILRDVAANLGEILRGEIRLVQAQIHDDATRVARAGLLILAGAALGTLAAGFVLLAIVYLLARVVDMWTAALAVGAGAGALACVLVAAGAARLKRIRMPRTSAALQEELQWAKAPNN